MAHDRQDETVLRGATIYFFAFKSINVGIPGNPISLQGASLDEKFDPKALDKEGGHTWHKPVSSVRYPPEEALDFPDELWLNTGERKIDFDFRHDMHGLILSKRFADCCGEELTRVCRVVNLHVVNRKGANISSRPMVYAKPKREISVLEDASRDLYRAEVDDGILTRKEKLAKSLTLKPDLCGELVFAKELINCLLIDETLAARLKKQAPLGLELTPHEDAVARYNDRFTMRELDGTPVDIFKG